MKKLILLAASGIYWFSLYVYVPFLTPELIALGVSATLTGVIVAAHSFVQVVLRFPIGLKSGALGRQKPFIALGMAFSALASLIMYFFPTPAMLLVGNTVSGFASTMYVAFTVLYAKYDPPTQTNRAMGTIGTVVEAGILCAFLVGGFAYQKDGIRVLFLISCFAAAAGIFVSLFVKEVPSSQAVTRTVEIGQLLKNKQLILSSVLCILVKAIVFATAFSFTPKAAQDMGASGGQIGVLNALFIGASVLGSYFITTKAGERIGDLKISITGFVLLGLYAAAIPFLRNLTLFMIVQFVGGLGYASLTAIFMANAVRRLKPEEKSAGMGLYQALYSIGSTAGPILFGILADAVSYTAGFLAMTGVAAVGIATAVYSGKKQLIQ